MVDSFSYHVARLHKKFVAFCNEKLQEMGLSQGLLYIILYIGKHPGCGPKEMATALHMDMGQATRTLAKLQQNGFLMQEQNPKDRRAHILFLTEKGETAFLSSYDLFRQWDEILLVSIQEKEQKYMLEILEKITERAGIKHV